MVVLLVIVSCLKESGLPLSFEKDLINKILILIHDLGEQITGLCTDLGTF